MSNYDSKKDVKYQVFVTAKMDDQVSQCAELMGMSKNEFIRYCLAQGVAGYNASVSLLRERIGQEFGGKA